MLSAQIVYDDFFAEGWSPRPSFLVILGGVLHEKAETTSKKCLRQAYEQKIKFCLPQGLPPDLVFVFRRASSRAPYLPAFCFFSFSQPSSVQYFHCERA